MPDTDEIRALVSRLDLDQKIGQIQGVVPMDLVDFSKFADPGRGAPDLSKGFPYELERLPSVRPHGVGHLSLGWQLDSDLNRLRDELARFQEIARDVNPFGIATLVHAEGINGLVHAQGDQFATAWGQAASWDPESSRRVGEIAARQARSVGIHLLFSPLLDVARDMRWGRVHETYGEDPELVARMGIGFIRGVQGDAGDSEMLATGKHFLAYAHSLGGLNQAATQLGRRELTDVHAEPFRRAIADAGLSVVMSSYNEIDGIPASANHWLLTELLRGELGFDGLVVSDYGAVTMLYRDYRTAATPGRAAADALTAGIDVELPSADTTSQLRPLVEDGTLSEEILDRAVANVLAIKARLGLVPDIRSGRAPRAPSAIDGADARALARVVAESAVTLLANDGILPLAPGVAKLAIVGPAADELRIHFGAYSSVADTEIPIAVARITSGRVARARAADDVFPDLFQTRLAGIEPVFEAGARALNPDATTVVDAIRAVDPGATYHPVGSFDDADLDQAALLTATEDADVVIAVVGERTGWVGNHTAGEGRTVANPVLPGNQDALVTALHRAGTRVVTVVVSGRPLLLGAVHDASSAVLLAPLLGALAGEVVADVLFGRIEPGGRLPSTFPRHVGQVPMYHGFPVGSGYEHPTLPRYGYVDLADSSPLYPFGHGLTYTSFGLELDDATFVDEVLRVRALVRNTGEHAGTAVVQLYARDEAGTVVRPVRQLVDFTRLALASGGAEAVDLSVPLQRLAYTWPDGRRGVEAGEVTLLLGLSSADIHDAVTFTIPELILD
ncbi:MAG TPA: glycoside hydrolase family 3 N-terminal domain-containing protein [Acidimicrobiia bacterium]|nr:glycoside hydrolase family 3 N-terminal domain-containing protein [Acidimicrobiia bacterium]